jgi:hypothetical protein
MSLTHRHYYHHLFDDAENIDELLSQQHKQPTTIVIDPLLTLLAFGLVGLGPLMSKRGHNSSNKKNYRVVCGTACTNFLGAAATVATV